MSYHLLFFLLTTATLHAGSEGGRICYPGKLGKCRRRLQTFNQYAPTVWVTHREYPCGESINIQNCFSEYSGNCFTEKQKAEDFLTENLGAHIQSFESHCSSSDCVEPGKPEDADQCLQVVRTGGTLISNDDDDASQNMRKCAAFTLMSNCLVGKVSFRCGEQKAIEYRQQLKLEGRGIIDACNKGEDIDFDLGYRK